MPSPQELLERQRVRLGLTQEALAADLNVHKTTVSRWESGDREPSESQRAGITRRLGFDPWRQDTEFPELIDRLASRPVTASAPDDDAPFLGDAFDEVLATMLAAEPVDDDDQLFVFVAPGTPPLHKESELGAGVFWQAVESAVQKGMRVIHGLPMGTSRAGRTRAITLAASSASKVPGTYEPWSARTPSPALGVVSAPQKSVVVESDVAFPLVTEMDRGTARGRSIDGIYGGGFEPLCESFVTTLSSSASNDRPPRWELTTSAADSDLVPLNYALLRSLDASREGPRSAFRGLRWPLSLTPPGLDDQRVRDWQKRGNATREALALAHSVVNLRARRRTLLLRRLEHHRVRLIVTENAMKALIDPTDQGRVDWLLRLPGFEPLTENQAKECLAYGRRLLGNSNFELGIWEGTAHEFDFSVSNWDITGTDLLQVEVIVADGAEGVQREVDFVAQDEGVCDSALVFFDQLWLESKRSTDEVAKFLRIYS